MNRLGIIFIIVALILSAILSGFIYSKRDRKTEIASTAKILVATRSLSQGQTIKDADVQWKTWPQQNLSPSYIVEGLRRKEDIVGGIVRFPLNAGQPITDTVLISKANLSPLASVISPGMRAYTINVPEASALGGFVAPGDFVDIILSYSVTAPGSADKTYLSKTVLNNVQVLAVDLNLTATPDTATSKTAPGAHNTKNVTLEVTPQQADLLAVGASMGTLSLSLTTPSNSAVVPAPATKEEKPSELTLIRGDKMEQMGKNESAQ